ncbi:hypothetical protein [Flammeovirga kamogawensis]|uniref:Lipoxygenase domain-containing protein n=1 Tax=Flammeovirga kamogawensis TaxID=373891 RepID=A0ABX8H4Q1_9BACT|nr:hypothetical protein [Flammeovirga kamogawensis]MBB6460351.1 hypothetical protein [Flammeovirga kamogawensis]QWG10160.1 hypothetical protein KM029_20980 [Flammeovirga kamogawensis]TRX64612.1 hypothetical protein EO216_18910 [Flammeovirga kamogawensis]
MSTIEKETLLHQGEVLNKTYQLPKENFLYNREGPWPQPSPRNPKGEAPAVLRLPRQEKIDWKNKIGKRYFRNMWTYWPRALSYSIKYRGLHKIDNQLFDQYLGEGVFSKFLIKGLSVQKEKIFSKFLPVNYNSNEYYIIDLSLMSFTQPFKGIYSSATIVLFKKEKGKLISHLIFVDEFTNNNVVSRSDGNAWELAKVFVMQGASYKLILSEHALLHFPFDCINAISKSTLPINSILLQLLLPHFEHTLVLNKVVLNSSASPVENDQKFPYSGFLGKGEGQRSLVACAYTGIDGNDSYNGYRYSKDIEKFDSPYYLFLKEYYDTIEYFVSEVVNVISDEEMNLIEEWANHINQWLPTFSSKEAIKDKKTLVKEITMIIWDVSIAHSADHHSFAEIPSYLIPLRVRINPKDIDCSQEIDWKNGMNIKDMFRYRMEREMFFKPTNVSNLFNTYYHFEKVNYSEKTKAYLKNLNAIFLKDLEKTEQRIKSKNIPVFIPLKKIARSIQY